MERGTIHHCFVFCFTYYNPHFVVVVVGVGDACCFVLLLSAAAVVAADADASVVVVRGETQVRGKTANRNNGGGIQCLGEHWERLARDTPQSVPFRKLSPAWVCHCVGPTPQEFEFRRQLVRQNHRRNYFPCLCVIVLSVGVCLSEYM